MPHLFDPLAVRGVTLPNRIGVSPMCEYSCKDGFANDWHLVHLGARAVGGAGLVFTEAAAVSPEGRIAPEDLGVWSEAHFEPLARIAAFIAQHGAVPGLQLAHAGRKGSTFRPWSGNGVVMPAQGGWTPVGPDSNRFADNYPTPAPLSDSDIARIRDDFVAAAKRAVAAGFRVLEVHAAHGYLLHEFLSPISNQRSDGYGGSSENRMRFPLEVFAACRAAWPTHKPMGIRLSATDWVDGGWTPEETVAMAKRLKTLGCDYVDLTSAGLDPRQKIPLGPGYNVPFAEQVKREAAIRTMAVGMITDPHQAEQIIASGQADLVALARSMLLDPRWAWHAAQKLGVEAALPPNYARAHPKNWPQAFPQKKAAE